MTVQELINALNAIDNKRADICLCVSIRKKEYFANITHISEMEDSRTNVIEFWIEGNAK